MLHDALEAVEDVGVECALHGILLEGGNGVLDDTLLSRAAKVTPPAHLLIVIVARSSMAVEVELQAQGVAVEEIARANPARKAPIVRLCSVQKERESSAARL